MLDFLRRLGADGQSHGPPRQLRSHRYRQHGQLGVRVAGANRRVLYNRASCDPSGKPFNPDRKLIAWNGTAWGGADVPDFKADEDPTHGMGPFIMNPEGVARFFARGGMGEGPFPEHYEPMETPLAKNPLSANQPLSLNNPAVRMFDDDRKAIGKSDKFPACGHDLSPDRALPLLDQARAAERHHSAGTVC